MSTYFARLPEFSAEFGKEIIARKAAYYNWLRNTRRFERMLKSEMMYFGLSSTNSGAASDGIRRTGEQGEYVTMRVNHIRNLGQHLHNLCTSQRPAPQPIAQNSDARTHAQVTLAHGLLDYYSREKRVERHLRLAAEYAILYSEGWIKVRWNPETGQAVGVRPKLDADGSEVVGEDGRPVIEGKLYEGDVEYANYSPIDVIRDPGLDGNKGNPWYIVRDRVNKYDLLAQYTAEDEQRAIEASRIDSGDPLFNRYLSDQAELQSDQIHVYEFIHEKTPACPDGRHAVILEDGTVLLDGPNTGNVKLRKIVPSEHCGTPFGYSPLFDLLAIQEAIDALYSIILTNQTTFGVQTLLVPKGHNLTYQQIAKGLALIEYDSKLGKPEALNLTFTPQEIFNFIRQLEDAMETISGINSTVRGNPEASLKSGSALALIQSQAIQYSLGLQQSYAHIVEDVYTDTLTILREFARSQRVVAIIGKHKRHMLKEFYPAGDLDLIQRVVVDSGSALSKTAPGRIQIAQDLMNNGMIKTAEEYLAVINTGTLDPIMEGDNAELILIRQENEALGEGRLDVPVTDIDAHTLHIKEHKSVLASLEARRNEDIKTAALAHILQHIDALRSSDPDLLSLLGEQPLGVPPMDPAQAGGGSPPKNGPGGAGAGEGAVPQLPNLVGDVKQPAMPMNPATGQDWDPVTGGGAILAMSPAGLAAAPPDHNTLVKGM